MLVENAIVAPVRALPDPPETADVLGDVAAAYDGGVGQIGVRPAIETAVVAANIAWEVELDPANTGSRHP